MPRVTGTITRGGTPLGGAYVRLIGPSGEFAAEAYTPDSGAFVFHVVAGAWKLEVRAAGSEPARKTVEVGTEDTAVDVDLQ